MHLWFQILAITLAFCLHTSVFAQEKKPQETEISLNPVRSCMLRSEVASWSKHLIKTDSHTGVIFTSMEARELLESMLSELPMVVTHIYYVVDDLADCEDIGIFRYPMAKK